VSFDNLYLNKLINYLQMKLNFSLGIILNMANYPMLIRRILNLIS